MQHSNETYDYLMMLVSITFLLLLMGTGISFFVIYYYRKRRAYLKEKEELKVQFERSLLQAQLEIREHTLNHVSQEIHDNVGQTLSVTKMQLNILEQRNQIDDVVMKAARDNLAKATSDLRDLAKGLSSDRITHFSLLDNAKEEMERIRNSQLLSLECMVTGTERPMQEDKKLIAFRMIQECLQNILKHACAKNVLLSFTYADSTLQILIQDDGVGFNVPDAIEKRQGLGLQHIIRRASLMGGNAAITSTIAQGTTVNINLPYA